jgi:hypothetical protein
LDEALARRPDLPGGREIREMLVQRFRHEEPES